jgi:hypothetical protein
MGQFDVEFSWRIHISRDEGNFGAGIAAFGFRHTQPFATVVRGLCPWPATPRPEMSRHSQACMAPLRKSEAKTLAWVTRPKPRRAPLGLGRVRSWQESTHAYRIDEYLDYDVEPFFALVQGRVTRTRRRWELISRHGILTDAMRACERHAAASGERIE